jgi:hypothetical protein
MMSAFGRFWPTRSFLGLGDVDGAETWHALPESCPPPNLHGCAALGTRDEAQASLPTS